jgi:hypothetical protein
MTWQQLSYPCPPRSRISCGDGKRGRRPTGSSCSGGETCDSDATFLPPVERHVRAGTRTNNERARSYGGGGDGSIGRCPLLFLVSDDPSESTGTVHAGTFARLSARRRNRRIPDSPFISCTAPSGRGLVSPLGLSFWNA